MNDSSDEGGALVDARPKASASSKSKPVKAAPAPAKKRGREIVPVVAEGIDEGDSEEENDDDDGESKGRRGERKDGREATVTRYTIYLFRFDFYYTTLHITVTYTSFVCPFLHPPPSLPLFFLPR